MDHVKTEEFAQPAEHHGDPGASSIINKKGRDLTLAIVGEVRGEPGALWRPTLPFGGFERRDTLLEQLRDKGPGLHLPCRCRRHVDQRFFYAPHR